MKTYEEMAQSALARGKAMRSRRKKINKLIVGSLSGIAVCCLVILLAFGIGEKDTMNYGSISFLSVLHKTDTGLSGKPFQNIGEMYVSGDNTPPHFQFQHGYIHVVAKAVEEYPDIYETLNEYGSTQTYKYRLFRMEVIDPLQSGVEGTFFYLLPLHLKGDLTQYDALLISMFQLPKNYVLRSGDQVTAFEYLFADPYDEPQMGNIIAFTDGVFDESLWQDRSWFYGYQFGRCYLDENDDLLLVSRGSTLEETLQRRQAQIDECYALGDLSEWWHMYEAGKRRKTTQVRNYDFRSEAAKEAMTYLQPYENGIFAPKRIGANYFQDYRIHRYINGCPTNEWIQIDSEDETVTASQYRFEDADYEKLPDISTYIASLDLSQIVPQHTDPANKTLIYNSAVGWYEKTENGVYSIVRIAWRYFDQKDYFTHYYDETFILLDETGDNIVSREKLIKLIGENCNIYQKEYGVAISIPM